MLSAQSNLIKEGFKVPETIAIGEVKVYDVPATATMDQVDAIVDEAILNSSSSKTTHIRFATGVEYRLGRTNGNPIFSISQRKQGSKSVYPKNLIFDGRGSKFIVTSYSAFMSVRDYNNIIVKDFEIDNAPRYITHGVVSNWNWSKSSCDVTIDAGQPQLLGNPNYESAALKWMMPVELVSDGGWGMIPQMPSTIGYGNVASKGNGVYSMTIKANCDHGRLPGKWFDDPLMRNVKNGMHVALLARTDGHGAFYIYNGTFGTFRDITIHHCPASLVCDQWGERNVYYNVQANVGGATKFCSTADGIFVTNQRNGPWIEKCHFRGIGDDAIVLKNAIGRYVSKSSNAAHPYALSTSGRTDYRVGDTLVLYNMKTRQKVSAHRITAVADGGTNASTLVNVTPAILATPGNADVWIYNLNNQCNNFVLKDNVLEDYRRWGVLCGGANGTIQGNRFIRGQNAAIYLVNSDNYHSNATGAVPRNVEIRDNYFEKSWHAFNSHPFGVIASRMNGNLEVTRAEDEADNDVAGDWNGITNIKIVNNKFKDWYFYTSIIPTRNSTEVVGKNVAAIFMRDADGVVIKGNEFEMTHEPYKTLFAKDVAEGNGDLVIRIVDCDNVVNCGNTHGNDAESNLEGAEVNKDLSIFAKEGVVHLRATTACNVKIHALDGRILHAFDMSIGECMVQGLQSGVYIVNGEKLLL